MIKPPAMTIIPIPTRIGTDLKNTSFLEDEVIGCCNAKKWGDKPTSKEFEEVRKRVYAAYDEPPPKF